MAKGVVCVGSVTLDRIYLITNLPSRDGGAWIVDRHVTGGGVDGNVATAVARLGYPASVVPRVANDEEGRLAIADLARREHGIVRRVTPQDHVPGDDPVLGLLDHNLVSGLKAAQAYLDRAWPLTLRQVRRADGRSGSPARSPPRIPEAAAPSPCHPRTRQRSVFPTRVPPPP